MKKLLSVTFFTGLLTLCRMISGFIISKVIAVYTGTSGMALLGQMQSFVTMLNGIVSAPTGNAIVRYTSEYSDQGVDACSPWWRAALQWSMFFCIPIIPIGIILSKNISVWLFGVSEYQWLICLMFVILPLSALSTLVNSVINGFQNYKLYVILGSISILVSTCVMIFLVIRLGVKGALIASVIQSAIIGLILLIASFKQPWFRIKYWIGSTPKEVKKKIGGYVLMAIVSSISLPFALIAIRKIIIYQLGWDAAGQWQAVWKISEVYLSVTTMTLSIYFLPQLAKLKEWKDIRREINSTARVIVPIVILMACGIYLFRDVIISILFTDKFRNARELFLVQLIGDTFKIISWLYAYPMISRGAAKWFISSEIIFSVFFVILTLFLVPILKANGVNFAYAINYFIYLLFSIFFVKKAIMK